MMTVATLPDIDTELVHLCDAMNTIPGLKTFESCSGHGERNIRIYFRARRHRAVNRLATVVGWRQTGFDGWRIRIMAGHSGRKLIYVLESTLAGPEAYAQAEEIAPAILNRQWDPDEVHRKWAERA